jgi:hypothetical protein
VNSGEALIKPLTRQKLTVAGTVLDSNQIPF